MARGRAGRGGVGLHLTTRLAERFRPDRRPRLRKRGVQYHPIFLNACKVAEPYSVFGAEEADGSGACGRTGAVVSDLAGMPNSMAVPPR